MSRSLSQRSSSSAATSGRPVSATAPLSRVEDESAGNARTEADEDDECFSARDQRFWWTIAGLSGATAVVLGAFGAHGLKAHVSDPRMLANWQTAANYHLAHSFALALAPVVVGAMRRHRAATGRGVWAALKHNLGFGARTKKAAGAAAAAAVRLQPYNNWSARCFAVGTLIFSGSLYALVLTDARKLGAVTPLGGFALIAGWLFLAIGL